MIVEEFCKIQGDLDGRFEEIEAYMDASFVGDDKKDLKPAKLGVTGVGDEGQGDQSQGGTPLQMDTLSVGLAHLFDSISVYIYIYIHSL